MSVMKIARVVERILGIRHTKRKVAKPQQIFRYPRRRWLVTAGDEADI